MTSEDARRWNARYQGDRYATFDQPRPFLVNHADLLPGSGLGCDMAMGLGGNAGFLLNHGLRVVGVDISEVAVRRAKQAHPELMAVIGDVLRFYLPAERFDVLLNFYFLERSLWPTYEQALKPGGVLFFHTLMRDAQTDQQGVDPVYLLEPGELGQAFPGLETLFYQETREASRSAGKSGPGRVVASLIAKKPEI